ncbi:MAG TPA: 2-dehydro-3-deoxygalactonokinase [Chitinophagaceae bacterium]|nr:2-dehydro-3-deoxygalactonokinase [Chitinophagaceae bacterium]
MPPQKKLLCCDWGTSAFRLLLVDVSTSRVQAMDETDQGIARTFKLWQQSVATTASRKDFYLGYIEARIAILEKLINSSLKGVPLILSGMASSSVGIEELPYKALPFAVNGSDAVVKSYKVPTAMRGIFLVSGVKSKDDEVMRGEETLLIGSASEDSQQKETWFIFPGTHSKHVFVSNGHATELRTFMTGEFFELLTRHSILALSVSQSGDFGQEKTKENFVSGVLKGLRSNLLHSCFSVRTNKLFHHCNDHENYYFLSGLLIGTELSVLPREPANLVLVCGISLGPLYETALEVLKADGRKLTYSYRSAEEALIQGQLKIHSLLDKRP